MLSLFICAYLFSNRMTPRIENIASKEINQFIQILINHTSFTQKIDTHKLYKKENNSISFQMNYINDIASNYINNLEETLLKLEEGSYQENNHSPYNKKLLKINQQKGIVARIPIGSLTNNIFLQDRGPSFSIKYKTLSLTSSNIDKKIKNYGINHLTYEDEHYYLTNKPFPLYYQKYISLLQINPFKIINNIYQQKNSQGYILYQVQSIPLDIKKIISLSLIPQETKTIKEIKKEWIQYYESILIYTPLNSLEYQIIYYSLFTLCQLSIELLNHYFLSTTAINLSYQHKNIHSYEDVYLIENINLNLYIHDIFYLYLNNTITINQLEQIINEYNLTSKDLQILLCYALFPQMCLVHFHEDSLTKKRRRLIKYNKKLYSLILLLQKYIQIPPLKWIKKG